MESKEKISKDIKQKPQIPLWYQKKEEKRKYVGGPGSLGRKETEEDKN